MIRLVLGMGLAQSGFHAFIASLPLAMVAVGRPDDEIGAIMGSAAVFNLMAALAAGGLIDRYGGRLVYTVGTTLLASGSLLLALGIVNADDPAPMLVLVRLLQGVGLAGVLPAVASLVPGMVSRARLPTALAFVGVAANVSMAVMPPISIAILNGASLQVLGGVMVAITALGLVLLAPIKRAERVAGNAAGGGRPRRFRPAWRPSWAAPIAITFLFVAHWAS